MRRSALLCCALAAPVLLAGCTGTGVFFDHTIDWFDENPNGPAGNSEMFQRLRGEPLAITPLLPEPGNVWPGPPPPELTLQEIEQQQQQQPGAPAAAGPADRRVPHSEGEAPAVVRPNRVPNLAAPPQQTPNGTSLDVTGGIKVPGYRQLQPPAPTGKGILVPNGNGTSTLIGPDGSISTVPTKP
jgi:hypothetical protein